MVRKKELDFRNFLVKLFFGKEWLSIKQIHKSLKEEIDKFVIERDNLTKLTSSINSRIENLASLTQQQNHNLKIEQFWDRLKRSQLDEKYFDEWAEEMRRVDNIIEEAKNAKS